MEDNNLKNEGVQTEVNNPNQPDEKKFKSELIERLVNKYKKRNLSEEEIKEMPKDSNAINLSDILNVIDGMSDEDVSNIIKDINNNNITIDINEAAIKILNDKNADQKKIQKLLEGIAQKINIDISSISMLSVNELKNINERCQINRVYVNSGYDKAAKDGYDVNKYLQIRKNADLMIKAAVGENENSLSDKEKFKKIYKYVVDSTRFDYNEVEARFHGSRNLDNFFTKGRTEKNGQLIGKGRAVCAGVADGLKNLCDCMGIEVEYVQGYGNKGNSEYHAWIRVKIDGKWYNADPTWDLGKVGVNPFDYFLKSDEDFKYHKIDNTYNPTYLRANNAQTITLSNKNYAKANYSMENATEGMVDERYIKKYIRAQNLQEKMYGGTSRISQEILDELAEKKIPAGMGSAPSIARIENRDKLSLKQKIANLLYKGKHLKNISFVKKFIDKNATIKENKLQTVPVNDIRQEIHAAGNLSKAQQNYKAITKNTPAKEQIQKEK